jgi:hypothetical protein
MNEREIEQVMFWLGKLLICTHSLDLVLYIHIAEGP